MFTSSGSRSVFLPVLILALIGISLSACSNYKAKSVVDQLNRVEPVGSPFTKFLAAEYRNFANKQLNEKFDYADALHFARKGLEAAKGDLVMPEPLHNWNLIPQHLKELGSARDRLIVYLDMGARELAPQQAAMAQVRYDCWVEGQEENWDGRLAIGCQKDFSVAMDKLEEILTPYSEKTTSSKSVRKSEPQRGADYDPSESLPPEGTMYLIFFDFDSHKVDASGKTVLDAIADQILGKNLNSVLIVGHTDRSGAKSYNEKLALRRANSVRDGLVKRGVSNRLLRVESRGENDLLVKTSDGIREPSNRRTEIIFN